MTDLKTIYFHDVDLLDGKGIIRGRQNYTVTELAVLGENEHAVVVEDKWFTTISKNPDDDTLLRPVMGKPSTSIYCADRCFGSGVMCRIYSFHRWEAASVRRHIKSAVTKKIGFFLDGLDLKFIKDAK